MTAFNNSLSSQTIDIQPLADVTAKDSTPYTSATMKVANSGTLGKSYPSKFATVVGKIKTLGEGKKITISLYVAGVLKSSKIYNQVGYTEDAVKANITDVDNVYFTLTTDDTVDTVTEMLKVIFCAGSVPASELLS